jgi:hypothetical protein
MDPIAARSTRSGALQSSTAPPVATPPKTSKPATLDIDFVPAKAPPLVPAGAPSSAAPIDVSQWPLPVLERNAQALRAKAGNQTLSQPERDRLAAIEAEIMKRDAAVPKIGTKGPDPKVELCKAEAEIALNERTVRAKHHWIRTTHKEVGLGGEDGRVPGLRGQEKDYYGKPVTLNDHTGRGEVFGSSCEEVPDVDEACVDEKLEVGKKMGRWTPPFNDCQTVAAKILDDCRKPAAPKIPYGDAGVP